MPTRPSLLSDVRSEEHPPLTPMPTTADESAANRDNGREGELPQRPVQHSTTPTKRFRPMAAPPVTCRRKTPAYATSTPAYSFWQCNSGTRTTSNRRPRRTPILLTPTCHKPRIPTIAHLQLRTIAQFQRIGTLQLTAQESTDNRGNGSQASEQLRPLPNLARPVTPTTSCEAPGPVVRLHRLLLLLAWPSSPHTSDTAWMATADQAQASAPTYHQGVV